MRPGIAAASGHSASCPPATAPNPGFLVPSPVLPLVHQALFHQPWEYSFVIYGEVSFNYQKKIRVESNLNTSVPSWPACYKLADCGLRQHSWWHAAYFRSHASHWCRQTLSKNIIPFKKHNIFVTFLIGSCCLGLKWINTPRAAKLAPILHPPQVTLRLSLCSFPQSTLLLPHFFRPCHTII